MPYQAARSALLEELRAAGFGDLNAAHLNVFQYPGPDGVQPSVLAERAMMSKQAMNHLLGQLEAKGYLRRAPKIGAGDARQRVVQLSARGRAVVAVIRVALERIERDWRRRLGADLFDRLREDLVALNHVLGSDVDTE
jgi:DNA-binding MarR family transcriptional regulator